MADENEEPVEEEVVEEVEEKKPKKKRRIGLNLAMAVLAMHERKQFSYQVNTKELAIRYNTTKGSLSETYKCFLRGEIEMPIGPTPAEELIDRRTMHETMRRLALRYTALITHQLEGALITAEDKSGKGLKKQKKGEVAGHNYREINSDVVFLARALEHAIGLNDHIDKGYDSYLEEARKRLHGEKPANPSVPIPAARQTAMISAGDTQRALAALDLEVVPAEKPADGTH
jgi:hypothetical protein